MSWLDRLLRGGAQLGQSESMDPTLGFLCVGLPPDQARNLREERAAILEHEGGFHREEAERRLGLAPTPPPLGTAYEGAMKPLIHLKDI